MLFQFVLMLSWHQGFLQVIFWLTFLRSLLEIKHKQWFHGMLLHLRPLSTKVELCSVGQGQYSHKVCFWNACLLPLLSPPSISHSANPSILARLESMDPEGESEWGKGDGRMDEGDSVTVGQHQAIHRTFIVSACHSPFVFYKSHMVAFWELKLDCCASSQVCNICYLLARTVLIKTP